MFKPDRIRRWFGYSRRERQGTYLLSLILLVVLIVRLAGLVHPDSLPVEEVGQSVEKQTVVKLVPFNPNCIGIDDLVQLGLSHRQATTLDNYRQAGGKFRKPEDFRKVYGIDSSLQEKLIPYIFIDKADREKQKDGARRSISVTSVSRVTSSSNEDGRNRGGGSSNEDGRNRGGGSSAAQVWQHTDTGNNPVRIELNSADSLLLKSLPGIGNVLSSRIVRYRNLLGGFVSLNQLREVYGIDSTLAAVLQPMLFIDTALVRRVDINMAGYGALLRHPYISDIEASLIIRYRSKTGFVESTSELVINRIIEPERFRRVFPYLSVTNDSIFLPA